MLRLRLVFLSILLFLMQPQLVLSQFDPIADSLDWKRYFPIEINNEWQYRINQLGVIIYSKWKIQNDTLIGEERYFNMHVSFFDSDFELTGSNIWPIRYDTINANVVIRSRYVNGEWFDDWLTGIPCRLNAPFEARSPCTGTRTTGEYLVRGYPNVTHVIGSDTVHASVRKSFESLGGAYEMLSDLGLITRVNEGETAFNQLIYASIAGQEFGVTPIPTSFERVRALPDEPLITGVYPNPFRSNVVTQYQIDEQGSINIELYNMLGQRVFAQTEDVTLIHERREILIEGRTLKSGTYILRLTTASGKQDTHTLILAR